MTYKNQLIVFMTLLCVAGFSAFFFTEAATAHLKLNAKHSKATYLLGEPVEVQFAVSNLGSSTVKVARRGIESGSLRVYISNNGKDYEIYYGPDWAKRTTEHRNLNPGEVHEYEKGKVFWRPVENTHVFPKSGDYYVKGVLIVENDHTVESEPVKIEIAEPTGRDLDLWNEIKTDRQIAMLLQAGYFDTTDNLEQARLTVKVEGILAEYHSSIYTEMLNTALSKNKLRQQR